MRAKKSDGTFREPFDPIHAQYGSDYTEGNAWQYSWYVPHDVQGLIELMGGRERFVEQLDQLFTLKVDPEQFKQVEDIAGLIGQYAHGNEPSQHIAYLYSYAGQPWRTQERIRQIIDHPVRRHAGGHQRQRGLRPDVGLVHLQRAGLLSGRARAASEYVIGAPQVPEGRASSVGGGKTFTVEAEQLSDAQPLHPVRHASTASRYDKAFLRHEDIMRGGTLAFVMGPKPNRGLGHRPRQRAPIR